MQGIADPDLFQLSEVVEKSSKSGIFSNRRLLMIKDGFLYYYSKVPSDYKGHEANVMNQLKEYPKCSIQIRMLKDVQAQSPKSSTLIICFNSKDMIDRQDILKSVQSKNFLHPVKTSANQEQQWRFTFKSFMRCRVWYASLHKLMDHFKKNNDGFNKFTEYMANFDTELRKSLPRVSPSSKNNRISAPNTRPFEVQPLNTDRLSTNISPDKYNIHKDGIFAIPEAAEQYDDNESHQSYNNKNNAIGQKKEKDQKPKEVVEVKPQVKFQPVNKHTEIQDIIKVQALPTIKQTKKIEENKQKITSNTQFIPEYIQSTKKQNDFKTQASLYVSETTQKEESKQPTSPSKLRPQKQKQSTVSSTKPNQEQENRLKMLELAESVRKQQRKKAEMEADLLQETIKQKEQEILRMREEIQANRIAQLALQQRIKQEEIKRLEEQHYRQMLERQKKQDQEYRKIQDSLACEIVITAPPTPSKELILVQESMQTDFEKDKEELTPLKQLPNSTNKKSVLSQALESVWSPTFGVNSIRSMSYLGEINIQTKQNIEDYDYFWEMSQIYKQQNTSSRLGKQLSYASFVTKASRQATTIIQNYIDQNKPAQTVKIDRLIFEIQIVCEKGNTIKTEDGKSRLIYNNQNHQRLKRTFKIYNRLHNMIIAIIKKKPNFSLRVPFCCLVEYKGYTALAQIIPAKQYPSKELTLLKMLSNDIPTYNLKLTDFEAGGEHFSLATANIIFKASKEDEVSLVRGKYCDFLQLNRQNHISIETKKLFEQVNEIENNKDRSMIAETLAFCRQLKKIMKHTTPFAEPHYQFRFLDYFFANPSKFTKDNCTNDCAKTGFTLYFIERLLGIKLSNKWKNNKVNYQAIPVVRTFSLTTLDAYLFANKFQKFCLQKKFQLAEQALKFSKQLDQNYNHILLKEVELLMYQQRYNEALQKIECVSELFHTHQPEKLTLLQLKAQCLEAIGQNDQVLSCYRELLEETQYMYGNQSKLAQIYFLIAGTFARQGRNKQLVQVYRQILKQYPSYRNRVIIQFCETLLSQQTDPHIILDFIQQETSQQTQKYSLDIQMLLGDLYLRCRNVPKAFLYYQEAFQMLQTANTSQITNLFLKLIECTNTHSQRKNIHRQLLTKFSHNNFTKQQIQLINNKVAQLIATYLNNSDRHTFMCLLHETQLNQQLFSPHSSFKLEKLADWPAVEQCIQGISNRTVSINQLRKYANLQRLFQVCSRTNTMTTL